MVADWRLHAAEPYLMKIFSVALISNMFVYMRHFYTVNSHLNILLVVPWVFQLER